LNNQRTPDIFVQDKTAIMTQINQWPIERLAQPMSLAATEQASGLPREVLRKWEQRYGFPKPLRDARGQRMYLPADVLRLQLIKRLLNQGLRPGKLVPMLVDNLHALLAQSPLARKNPVLALAVDESVQALLACLAPAAGTLALRPFLERTVKSAGLALFVESYLPAFNQAIGAAWADGHLGVYAEHHYTETVRQLVLTALSALPASQAQPRVLLTTPPGELHGLGLLALQAALMLQGAHCIGLGTQTPANDVVQAVHELGMGVGVVAVSASGSLQPDKLQRYLRELHSSLPPDCLIWVGGTGCAALTDLARQGLQVFQGVQDAVLAWQDLNKKSDFLL
jgi:DNA-binding transcriptional MerR regulator/methylmalonyl-CoA mutase cobalamin-binding subunit